MKKINLKEISEVLSDAELKNVLGGVVTTSSGPFGCLEYAGSCSGPCLLSNGTNGYCTMYLIPYSCRCQ